MNRWQLLRILLLATTFGGVLLVLLKSILYPAIGDYPDNKVSSFVFPAAVPLAGWQSLESKPLNHQTVKSSNFVPGRQYRYSQKNITLEIEMRYLVDPNADVNNFIKSYTPISSSAKQVLSVLRRREGIGFYSLFVHQQRAYLSACINFRGGSTVTDRQFWQNRNTRDVFSSRFVSWLLGQSQLRNPGCLWSHLSIPLKNSSHEEAYQTLEKAWVTWYKWWHPRFPNP